MISSLLQWCAVCGLSACAYLIPEDPSAPRYNTVQGEPHRPALNAASAVGPVAYPSTPPAPITPPAAGNELSTVPPAPSNQPGLARTSQARTALSADRAEADGAALQVKQDAAQETSPFVNPAPPPAPAAAVSPPTPPAAAPVPGPSSSLQAPGGRQMTFNGITYASATPETAPASKKPAEIASAAEPAPAVIEKAPSLAPLPAPPAENLAQNAPRLAPRDNPEPSPALPPQKPVIAAAAPPAEAEAVAVASPPPPPVVPAPPAPIVAQAPPPAPPAAPPREIAVAPLPPTPPAPALAPVRPAQVASAAAPGPGSFDPMAEDIERVEPPSTYPSSGYLPPSRYAARRL